MKFPFYHQLDSGDCGPSCLRMIAKFYGRTFEVHQLREHCYANKNGVPLLGINDAAEHIGFRCTAVKSSFEKFAQKAIFPCIVHWRKDHFIVVYKIKVKKQANGEWTGKIYVADPAFGLMTYSVADFLDGWTANKTDNENHGTFLLLVPTLDFYHPDACSEKNQQIKLLYFLDYIRPYKKLFAQIILGMFFGLVFSFIFPFLSQAVVDYGIMNNNLNFIYLVLAAQVILSLSELVIGFIQSWILLHVTSRIGIALISDFIAKMLKLPISFFDSKNTGDIMQRIGDHSRIQSFLTGTSISTLFSFLNFFVFAGILAYYNLTMLLIFIVGHTFYIIWVLLFLKIRRELDFKHFDKASRNQSELIEIITGAEEIKLCGCEQKMRNRWESIQAELFRLGIKGLSISQIQSAGAFFLSNITNITLSILSAYLVINGEITLGMMMSLSYILGQLKGPIGAFIGLVHAYQDAKISLERLEEIHFQEDEDQTNRLKINQLSLQGKDIHLNNITFGYLGEKIPPVLKNISFTIPHNKTTAIVGESGSGKTTLIKLLLGYYEPQQGEILIGNTNLKNLNNKLWRSNCGSVMQNGFIFSATIAENIAISDNSINREKLYHAASLANINDFIETTPEGYNTKIGSNGNGISQGQRQRLLIARSIYKDPAYLFFDEATNALDANNERAVIENLHHFFQGRTAVVVAHRLSTVKYADQIIVLQAGEVAEIGTHRELLDKQGVYYNLVKINRTLIMAKRDKVEIRHEEIQELLGNPPSWLVRWGISVFAGIITVLIIGSSLFMYPQIIEAPIVMTTEQPPTWVIAKSSGKIDSIYVKNKELVSEGEIIAIIHNTAKVEDVLYLKNLLENDSIEKLNTIQKELQIGELQDSYSLLVKTLQQYEVFNKEQIYELREKAAYEEINSQKMYLKQLEKQSEIYKEAYLISQERYSADSILYKMKALSAKEYEQSLMQKNQDKTRYNQSNLDIISVSIHLAQLNKAIKEYMAEEKREQTEYHTTIMRLYNQLKSNILLWEQTYLLKAPITGLVSYSSFWSKHQHINAGEQSFAVIPHSPGKIIGKCKVPVSGIGKIMPQQEVNIKLDGFPYMEFGTIRGVVENISLIPIRIEQPLKVEYANWVEVSINNLTTTYGKEIPFTGELTGTASITTKEMSLLEHLLSPLKYLWSKKMTNHKHNKTTELENL